MSLSSLKLQVPIKEIYVYALEKNFRKVLLDEPVYEIRKRFTAQPPEVAEPGRKLEAALAEAQRAKSQLAEVRAELAEAQRVKFRMVEERAQLQAQLAAVQAQLAEAQAYIAELKRPLFGSKAEPLSAEQEAQLEQRPRIFRNTCWWRVTEAEGNAPEESAILSAMETL